MDHTIGTCLLCGGRVSIPHSYMSVVPPQPTCQRCGACMKQPHGQVIEMTPRKICSEADETVREALAAAFKRVSNLAEAERAGERIGDLMNLRLD